ncbi:OX-2 membrane glycoprotein-like isoform X2 [Macrotis lagotis]|uniref:OX-2 membrane glycoprotein-like isoform X2 n=1 Tax=Macrotis lagotis TaxID=92651 RepID=UPI003D694D69
MGRQGLKKFFSHSFPCCLIFGMTLVMPGWAQGNVVIEAEPVILGRPASLKCSLKNLQDILIVTWQKLTNKGPENMATFSESYGVVIQPAYKNKIEMMQTELRETTIIFMRTEVEDEGCYLCIFNIFGAGRVSGKPCLKLNVKPAVFLDYQISEGHLNVTCAATARPSPVISWRVGPEVQNSTKSTSHPNGTTTVTSILIFKDAKNQWGKEIFCTVKHMESEETYSVIPIKDGTGI